MHIFNIYHFRVEFFVIIAAILSCKWAAHFIAFPQNVNSGTLGKDGETTFMLMGPFKAPEKGIKETTALFMKAQLPYC